MEHKEFNRIGHILYSVKNENGEIKEIYMSGELPGNDKYCIHCKDGELTLGMRGYGCYRHTSGNDLQVLENILKRDGVMDEIYHEAIEYEKESERTHS